MASAGLTLDRAAVALLRQVADSEPLRPGEPAQRLGVEASHVTRTVQQLPHGVRHPRPRPERPQGPADRLADAGRRSVERVREAGARGMWLALGDSEPEELRQPAVLFRRPVDDFLACAVDEESGREADAPAATA